MDLGNYLRFVLALLFVLGLIGVLATVMRRYGFGMGSVAVRRGQERRLKLVEILPIDAKRRAVLLRRDDIEHLVILGANSETVVESSIPSAEISETVFSDVLSKTRDTATDTPPQTKETP